MFHLKGNAADFPLALCIIAGQLAPYHHADQLVLIRALCLHIPDHLSVAQHHNAIRDGK